MRDTARRLGMVLVVCLLPDNPMRATAGQPTADIHLVCWADIQTVPADDRRYTRYIVLSNPDVRRRWVNWSAAAGLVNGLSLSRRVVSPLLILLNDDDTLTVRTFAAMPSVDLSKDVPPEVMEVWLAAWGRVVAMRVNLLDYRQTTEQWDRLGDPTLEPLYHVFTLASYPAGKYVGGATYPAGEEKVAAIAPWLLDPVGVTREDLPAYKRAVLGLVAATGARVPVVEARNFVWQAAINANRKAGYYSWLRVTDRKSFERLTAVREGVQPLRDAVSDSGVSREPRAIERQGLGDARWYTFDQDADLHFAVGDRNPLEQLDRRKHVADAIEGIGRMDNGWWAWVLIKIEDGTLQDSAPPGVGYHHRSLTNSGNIDVNLSCTNCHDAQPGNGGLHPIRPYFRNLFAEPGSVALAARYKKTLVGFEEQYLTPFEPWEAQDKLTYAAAVFAATGLTPDRYAKNLYATFVEWDAALDIRAVADEHGIDERALVAVLQEVLVNRGTLPNVLANWTNPRERHQKIGRLQANEAYNRVELALRGLPVWPAELKSQLTPWRK